MVELTTFLTAFGPYGFGFAVLIYLLYYFRDELKDLKKHHEKELDDKDKIYTDMIKELKSELKEERTLHNTYVDKVSETLILVYQKLMK